MERINQANGRLKNANCRVKIRERGNKLYLQATLPPKPDSEKDRPYQQEIALGVQSTPAGVSLAEREARKISALLDCKQFDWEPYLSPRQQAPQTIGEWLARFEAETRSQYADITWETDYREVFIKLDESEPLTISRLLDAIERTEPNTRSRKRYCNALGKLAKFAGLDADFKSLTGSYSSRAVDPRRLPDDEAIARCFHKIKNPQWQYVYGLIATFGLRPHEVFFLDVAELTSGGETVSILPGLSQTKKHRTRKVWALYPEWIDAFRLREGDLPPVTGKRHSDYGDRISGYFRRDAQLPFKAYDLRHCWAVRRILFGFPDASSAQQMGHSLQVHSETYQAWMSERTHQAIQDRVMGRSDRPIAPV
jgi:integrase